MDQETSIYGPLTPDLLSIGIKEVVERAMQIIRKERFSFKRFRKLGHSGKMDDVVTSTDLKVQELYVKLLSERFPYFGIIGEEQGLSKPCTLEGHDIWFAIDPLDGTKAFDRKEPFGVSTMIALVADGKVIASYIGDVSTGEIFYTRPNSYKVHGLTTDKVLRKVITPRSKRSLATQYLILREHPKDYSILGQMLSVPVSHDKAGLFKNIEITSGSIGVNFGRVWAGTCGGILMRPGTKTPWDMLPVQGISQKLGYRWFSVTGKSIESWQPTVQKVPYILNFETLLIHETRVTELSKWCQRNKIEFGL